MSDLVKCGECENYTMVGLCHVCGAKVAPPELSRRIDYTRVTRKDGIVLAVLSVIVVIGLVFTA